MIYRMPRFDYLAPGSVEEAVSLLSQYGEKAKVLAGGTDLLVSLKHRKVGPGYLIGLSGLAGLEYIRQDSHALRIGALTTHQSIAGSELVKGNYGLLATACGKVGSPQIRNMGTIGGNLCNAGPSADSAPPLLVLDARLKLVSTRGQREVPLKGFFTGPFQTILERDELLTEIIVPSLSPRTGGSYQFLNKTTAVDETLVGVAALVVMGDHPKLVEDIRIALCSVAPAPMRVSRAESVLTGREATSGAIEEAAAAVANETLPRSRTDYRRKMSAVLTRRAIREALAEATV